MKRNSQGDVPGNIKHGTTHTGAHAITGSSCFPFSLLFLFPPSIPSPWRSARAREASNRVEVKTQINTYMYIQQIKHFWGPSYKCCLTWFPPRRDWTTYTFNICYKRETKVIFICDSSTPLNFLYPFDPSISNNQMQGEKGRLTLGVTGSGAGQSWVTSPTGKVSLT